MSEANDEGGGSHLALVQTPPVEEQLVTVVEKKKKKKKKKKRSAPQGPLSGPMPNEPPQDEALAVLDEILNSPVGRAWVTEDGQIPIAPDAPKNGVLAPLPRRKGLAIDPSAHASPPMARKVGFEVSVWATLGRLGIWLLGLSRYFGGTLWDRLLGRDTIGRRAVRLREVLERMGPSFVKLGQQLAIRADLLDYAYCRELSKMLDRVPPFPTEQAIEAIEREAGRPFGEIFAVLDPKPIGSASLACVYQAYLHNGERVAVKVRRPGIGPMIAADMRALSWLLRMAEGLTILRPGLTVNLRSELMNMLMEELNFHQEARYTQLFRQLTEDEGMDYVTAPRVYFEYSGDDVMVTEFVSGVFLSEVLTAMDRKDEVSLAQLATMGIDPTEIAKRLTMVYNWEQMESILFHADPHPANVIVRPGNAIVLIDFGSCGRFTVKSRRIWAQFHQCMIDGDVVGMVNTSIALLEPLPPIDLEAFRKELEAIAWEFLYANRAEHVEWWEKASGVMWLRIIAVTRRFNLPVNLDTLRLFRASFLYDTLIFRLCPDLDIDHEYKRYHRRQGKKLKRKIKKAFRKRLDKGLTTSDYHLINEVGRAARQTLYQFQRLVDSQPPQFGAMLGKAAFGASMFLRLASIAATFHLVATVGLTIYAWLTGQQLSPWQVFLDVATTKPYQVVLMLILLLVIRRSLMRLEDMDVE